MGIFPVRGWCTNAPDAAFVYYRLQIPSSQSHMVSSRKSIYSHHEFSFIICNPEEDYPESSSQRICSRIVCSSPDKCWDSCLGCGKKGYSFDFLLPPFYSRLYILSEKTRQNPLLFLNNFVYHRNNVIPVSSSITGGSFII